MTFHEGQEVDVLRIDPAFRTEAPALRRAVVIYYTGFGRYVVEFPDGTKAYYKDDQIRAINHAVP
jgi:hypothetical protein